MYIPNPPVDSKIRLDRSSKEIKLTWKNPDDIQERLITLAFVLAFLIFWFIKELNVITKLWNQFQEKEEIEYLLILVLGVWTIIGIVAILCFFRLLLGTGYSQLFLTKRKLNYNPRRISLVEFLRRRSKQDFALGLLLKQDKPVLALKSRIKNLQILPIKRNSLLFFDLDNKRIEVGQGLKASDKNWLYQIIFNWLQAEPKPIINSTAFQKNGFPELPIGSKIKTDRLQNAIIIAWKEPEMPLFLRIGYFLWVAFALRCWAWGEITAIGILIEIVTNLRDYGIHPDTWWDWLFLPFSLAGLLLGVFFFLFWLSFWTVAGIQIVISFIGLLLGSGKSELFLDRYEFRYKLGREPFFVNINKTETHSRQNLHRGRNYYKSLLSYLTKLPEWMQELKELFLGKAAIAIPTEAIEDIQLKYIRREFKLLFLTLDSQIEIGQHLSEPEKEWLYQVIIQQLDNDFC